MLTADCECLSHRAMSIVSESCSELAFDVSKLRYIFDDGQNFTAKHVQGALLWAYERYSIADTMTPIAYGPWALAALSFG